MVNVDGWFDRFVLMFGVRCQRSLRCGKGQ